MWFAAHFSCVFAGDLLITVLTAYHLLKSRKDVLPQTVGILRALVRLTFQTAAPASLCAMLNLIMTQTHLDVDKLLGQQNLISIAFNQALPKLYAFSMMWTLNARRSIRAGSSFSHSHSGRGDVELSAYGARIQVRTQTTTQHIDFKDPETDDTNDHAEGFKRTGGASP
ncbi:hypothetical protein LshimejAT787_1802210 [Lyophyllum shimeji]|uniref:DUF6534 domain-containing protein n=1 Tax=Lyophyllum shimeji TaxID=47721 RepID=A0A9P3Q0E0_LYOSH|nr:hypothetical protein LshimejAT787_1802210 [Lyophyllum shimeji]